MDADISGATDQLALDRIKTQAYRDDLASAAAFRTASLANAAAAVSLASPEEQRQDLYMDLIKVCLDARMKYEQAGAGLGAYVFDKIVADSLYMARKFYPIAKANLDLIKQGQNPI